jgi:hypothetical protein
MTGCRPVPSKRLGLLTLRETRRLSTGIDGYSLVPPILRTTLPIVAWPHGGKNFWLGLGALLIGVSFLLLAAVIAEFFVHAGSGADHFFLSLRGGFIFLILLFTFPSVLFSGMGFAGAGLTCFWDAARSDPVLEITADGLHDRRSGLSVPWTSVKSAKPLDRAVDLQFHGPVANWQNPFRVGVLFQRYRPKSDHVIVSIAYLDTLARVLAYTILTLTPAERWRSHQQVTQRIGNVSSADSAKAGALSGSQDGLSPSRDPITAATAMMGIASLRPSYMLPGVKPVM